MVHGIIPGGARALLLPCLIPDTPAPGCPAAKGARSMLSLAAASADGHGEPKQPRSGMDEAQRKPLKIR